MNSLSSIDSLPQPLPHYGVAEVAFPIAVPGIYDYAIPKALAGAITPGTAVLVPLRNRATWGVVVGIKSSSEHTGLKEIAERNDDRFGNSGSTLLQLYEWIAAYYQCDLGRVFKPIMRKGVLATRPKTVVCYQISAELPTTSLNDNYREIMARLIPLGTFTLAEAAGQAGASKANVKYLLTRGFLVQSSRVITRNPFDKSVPVPAEAVSLTPEQHDAVARIFSPSEMPPKPFLLFGITGSGKTHVYIEIAGKMLEQGKGVIVLVPEIALTPQTIDRFRAALGDVLTVIHSNMSDGERRDSLQELATGKKRMVIGVRSAVVAPVNDLGCIIVDEEHDGSYKQSDMEPRYNARDVAVVRGKMQHALVVLGSATPSFESYYNALSGKYTLIRLTARFGAAALPRVISVDMREEQRVNNWKPLSRQLMSAIDTTLDNNRQIILLLNRRGFSTVLLCQECGYTAYCPDCSVTLRYHRADLSLKCHLCGFIQPAPNTCPACRGEKIKYKGTGIQKVEEYLKERFPTARILRMDQDSTRKKGAHAAILGTFAERKADILLGTQMVAKGLNFPGVALVGVIAADTGLHLPDFRASERTFQLLTQVAGRAGRTDNVGEVIIQTYCPEESAIKCAGQHDYETFYTNEIESRNTLRYPPFGRLVRLIIVGVNEDDVCTMSERIAQQLQTAAGNELTIMGPVPAVLERVQSEVRYTILLKPRNYAHCSAALFELRKTMRRLPASIKLIIDVDPVNML